MRGIIFEGEPYFPNGKLLNVFSKKNNKIGQITSGIYSPSLKKNIGLSMILKEYWDIGQEVFVEMIDNKKIKGVITSLPFPK